MSTMYQVKMHQVKMHQVKIIKILLAINYVTRKITIEQYLLENIEYKSLISNFVAKIVCRVIFQ